MPKTTPIRYSRLRRGITLPSGLEVRTAKASDLDLFLAGYAMAAPGGKVPAHLHEVFEAPPGHLLHDATSGDFRVFDNALTSMVFSGNFPEAGHAVELLLVAVEKGVPVAVLHAGSPESFLQTMADSLTAKGAPNKEVLTSMFLGMRQLAKVHMIATLDPGSRRKGHASQLLEVAQGLYEKLRYVYLYGSFETDRELQGFYRRTGFDVTPAGGSIDFAAAIRPGIGAYAESDERFFFRALLGRQLTAQLAATNGKAFPV